MLRIQILLSLVLVALVFACAQQGESTRETQDQATSPVKTQPKTEVEPAKPLPQSASYYDKAQLVKLDTRKGNDAPGLHNVFHLSQNIISGSEPHGEEAFVELQKLGVKTIISVDGLPPEVELANKYGMRYVHIPIQYSGIRSSEIEKIAKSFVELDGPFYTHCFHGKHRGPAGAAIGRLVLDGAPREQAMAEMRQWCGTSSKYEGLYRTIATSEMPSRRELKAFKYDFPSSQLVTGMVPAMSQIARGHDNVMLSMNADFLLDPEHPDIDALNEAKKLLSGLEAARVVARQENLDADFQEWAHESVELGRTLVEEIKAMRLAQEGSLARAKEAFGEIRGLCSTCHKVYRDMTE